MQRPCILITYPFALGHPNGGARHCREIARHLGKLGANVLILSVLAVGHSRYPRTRVLEEFIGLEFDRELSQWSVRVIRIPQHLLHWRLDGLPVKKALKKILKQRRVDMVLSYFHEGAFLPRFLRSHRIKFGHIAAWQSYALAFRGSEHEGRLKKFVRKWIDQYFIVKPHRQADILFANSRFTRNEVLHIMGVEEKRILVCPLGVEPSFTQIPRSEPTEITRFIFFGRFTPFKGIRDAIEALGQLAAKGCKNWSYRVFGQGPQKWVQKLAHEHGIGDRVFVSGPLNDEGLRRELRQAHLAILPSHAESFGLSIAEAQAAGIPVVAYECGSVPEVVENGVTAWLAPFRRVDRLAQCIETAVRDPKRTYEAGLAGREHVMQRFTWDKTAAKMFESIETLCSNGAYRGAA
ncbi:glycosyltransferase family 4 protein [candidate division KSB1 bacterium]|nr:glycosyltransferase family 4 protein [candidate division KSB1 bacterium]NIR73110.1 glycosyltransferase family 4 protein [candidate division KSB1 bacterium]NIT75204.1 glycosyltransferase family 4 protein [candidate division KSB1 bacterium]NIU29043.1 glycosyltransferase family 4 protein [candidate division KSB1 bacterium]NIU94401.1 glycosyltransferase [candidate division KSB1 bacterium]